VIVFANVVGYSRLMADDEPGTLNRWSALYKNALKPEAERRRGRLKPEFRPATSDAGASLSERAPFVTALKAAQADDGSWSVLPDIPGEAYATGEALYALHVSGSVPTNDPTYQKGVRWLLRNQLTDGSWFMPTRAVPVQPHTFESGFPHGWHQFASTGASSWAAMALLLTLPDKRL